MKCNDGKKIRVRKSSNNITKYLNQIIQHRNSFPAFGFGLQLYICRYNGINRIQTEDLIRFLHVPHAFISHAKHFERRRIINQQEDDTRSR